MPVASVTSAYTATIASGASLSGAVSIGSDTLVLVEMPAAWTDAPLSFQVSSDGVTYREFRQYNGPAITLPSNGSGAEAGVAYRLDPEEFAGVSYLKVRSGLEGAGVNQAAARTINLVGRPW